MDQKLLKSLKDALALLIDAHKIGVLQIADGGLSLNEMNVLDESIGNVKFLIQSEIKRP